MIFNFWNISLLAILCFTFLLSLGRAQKFHSLSRSATCPLLLPEHESVRQSRLSGIHRNSKPSTLSSPGDSRIYDGDLGDPDLHNYIVEIFNSNSNSFCTGVRIGPSLALGTAGCINGSTFVYLGRNSTEQRVIVDRLWNTNFFSTTTNERFEYNIGIIRYSGESDFSKTMRISINNSLPEKASSVRVAGLGRNLPDSSTNGNQDLDIYTVDLPVDNESDCQDRINTNTIPLDVNYNRQVCAGYGDRECGVCAGDLGAPMFQYDSEGVPVVVGVVALTLRNTCTGRFPTIAVRTAPYRQTFLDEGLAEGVDLVSSLGLVQRPNDNPTDTQDDSNDTNDNPTDTQDDSNDTNDNPTGAEDPDDTNNSPPNTEDDPDSSNNDPPTTGGGSNNNTPGEDDGGGVSIGVIIGAAAGGVVLIVLIVLLLIFCLKGRKEKEKVDESGKVPVAEDAIDQDPQVTVDPSAADPQVQVYEQQHAPAELYQAPIDGSPVAQAPATDSSLGEYQVPVDPVTGQYATTLPEGYSSQTSPQNVPYSVPLDTSQPTYPSTEQVPQTSSQTTAPPEGYPTQADASNITYSVPLDASQQSYSSPQQNYQQSAIGQINNAPVSNPVSPIDPSYSLPQSSGIVDQNNQNYT